MLVAADAVGLFEAVRIAAAGFACLVAPGALVLTAARVRLHAGEWPAWSFAASLVLLAAAFAGGLLVSASLAAAPALLAAATAPAVLAVRALGRSSAASRADDTTDDAGARLSAVALAVLVVLAAALAAAFAPVGSIDRWWYLAYVRGYLVAPELTLAEPFLGTGLSFARFGVHPWLFGLAMWSRLSAVDPVTVYETAAPVLAVLVSASAAWSFVVAIFGLGRRARLGAVASVLLWSGAMVPVLARAGEDKVLAASALMPLCFVALLRCLDRGGRHAFFLLFVASAATAAVHSLDYAFVLAVAVPAAALVARRQPGVRHAAAVAVLLLAVVAVVPAGTGLVVRERLADIGAERGRADHPVVRVHEGRDRLVDLPAGGYVVRPRLLLHPLVLLALAAVPVLLRRGRLEGDVAAEVRDERATFVAVATVVPLAVAFLPPLPVLAGSVIPPWMVYRVLWAVPLAALAAAAADRVARLAGRGEGAALLLLLLLGAPALVATGANRFGEMRARLAVPAGEDFDRLVTAVAGLPPDSLVAAPPELSERLPALTGRKVAATLDRSTIVFSGSRERGEARLRARAAVLTGEDDTATLTTAGIHPTHALFDPRGLARPRCKAVVDERDTWSLCELAAPTAPATPAPSMRVDETPPAFFRFEFAAKCAPDQGDADDPWSAAAPVATCIAVVPDAFRDAPGLYVLVETSSGRAVDEVRIVVEPLAADGTRASPAPAVAVVRGTGRRRTALLPDLPPGTAAVEIRVLSTFLPRLRLGKVALAVR